MSVPYRPRVDSLSSLLPVRGLHYHVRHWGGTTAGSTPPGDEPLLVMVHGWMDVGASFQFVVDALAAEEGRTRRIAAPDWRGFGLTDSPGADSYWFPDYLGDLDTLLDELSPDAPVDLLGHSLGGNVAMHYAGVRPRRVRRLINLEGFGLPRTVPAMAPGRLAKWLDELKEPATLRPYDSLEAVAERLMKNNPRLPPDRAAWLAPHWARLGDDGRWHLLGDPAHKRVNPVLYQADEVLAIWKRISAPLLWVEGDLTDVAKWWGDRYPRSEFEARLAVVPQQRRVVLSPAGHMLHHEQPEALARELAAFLA